MKQFNKISDKAFLNLNFKIILKIFYFKINNGVESRKKLIKTISKKYEIKYYITKFMYGHKFFYS